MKYIIKLLIASVVLLGLAPLAGAYQAQNSEKANVGGVSKSITKGLNITAFPVKDVTMAVYKQIGAIRSRAVLGLWMHDISAYGGIPDATVDRWGKEGLASCLSKLGGRKYIVTLGGNTTWQTHFVSMANPIQGSVSPSNVQNYQRCSQIDLTQTFCNVYEYEFVVQAAQMHNGYLGGYIPLCYLTQGNACGLAEVAKAKREAASTMQISVGQ